MSTIASNNDWWATFQQKFDVTSVMRFFATELYVGEWDGYVYDINNYYLHSTIAGVFDFLPWGKDQAFTGQDVLLDPSSTPGQVFDRCLQVVACITAFHSARDHVAETIIGLDLVEEAHHIVSVIAPAIAADTRRHQSPQRQCEAANETVEFLVGREDEWRNNFRAPGSGITSAQHSDGFLCKSPAPIDPLPAADPPAADPPAATATTLPGVTINAGAKFTKSRAISLAFSWPEDASSVEVSNDPQFAVASTFGRAPTVAWTLAKLPTTSRSRTVYVRFGGVAVASDTIAIDDDAPVIKRLRIRSSLKNGTGGRYLLSVLARDSGSGSESIQVQTARNRKPISRVYASGGVFSFATRSSEIRIRVIDKAGNVSGWKTATLPS
jgi:hypothetical protein